MVYEKEDRGGWAVEEVDDDANGWCSYGLIK